MTEEIATSEAAVRLGVSVRHVRALIASGKLTRTQRGYVTAASLEALIAARAAEPPKPGTRKQRIVGPLALKQRARRARRKAER